MCPWSRSGTLPRAPTLDRVAPTGLALARCSLMSRVIVVTGGTAGVGRATARKFASEGDHVAVLARDPARLDATVAELQERGVRALGISTDVADAAQVVA